MEGGQCCLGLEKPLVLLIEDAVGLLAALAESEGLE